MDRTIGNFQNVAQIRAANRDAGQFFFEPSSMRFFNSRVEGRNVYGGRYFITSEQFTGSDGVSAPRRFTLREAFADGSINTVGEFQAYFDRKDAADAARALVRAGRTIDESDAACFDGECSATCVDCVSGRAN